MAKSIPGNKKAGAKSASKPKQQASIISVDDDYPDLKVFSKSRRTFKIIKGISLATTRIFLSDESAATLKLDTKSDDNYIHFLTLDGKLYLTVAKNISHLGYKLAKPKYQNNPSSGWAANLPKQLTEQLPLGFYEIDKSAPKLEYQKRIYFPANRELS